MTNDACEVLLVSAEWQSRALLLAELQEGGYGVTALPGMSLALRALATGRVRPDVVLIEATPDLHVRPINVEQMLGLLEGVPVILVVGAYDAADFEPLRERVAALLRRPIRVGSIVAEVRNLCD
jgi:hypothetical protein